MLCYFHHIGLAYLLMSFLHLVSVIHCNSYSYCPLVRSFWCTSEWYGQPSLWLERDETSRMGKEGVHVVCQHQLGGIKTTFIWTDAKTLCTKCPKINYMYLLHVMRKSTLQTHYMIERSSKVDFTRISIPLHVYQLMPRVALLQLMSILTIGSKIVTSWPKIVGD